MNTNTNKPQAQQPQKCPRCDSLNTKFCYYNNYSLSQPRYFCKTCRRYWTQGGTLRNVRVGGGCRKAKRAKSSAIPSSSAADPPQQQAPPVAAAQKDPSSAGASAPTPAVAAPEAPAPAPAISPFFHGGGGGGGGYLSSLAAIQSLNPSQPFNQMGTSSSNLSLLSGFVVPSLGSPIRPSQQFYQMGMIRDKEEDALFEAEQGLIQSSNWPGSFISDTNHKGSDASLWSRTTVSTNTSSGGNSKSNNDATASGSLSLIPNPHWPDLPRYDPPP